MPQDITVVTGDRSESPHTKTPLVIILDRLRSAHNVGNILRLADAINAIEVACCGYTACPPHPKLSKAAMGAEEIVSTRHFETAVAAINNYHELGYKVIAVETVAEAQSIWEYDFTGPTAIVLGNEALGVQQETLEVCDAYIQLPAFGLKNSINVSNCAAVVLFKAAEQLRLN
jgi:23S rRNA (guanosine2251-2'-O)-methyltransferase